MVSHVVMGWAEKAKNVSHESAQMTSNGPGTEDKLGDGVTKTRGRWRHEDKDDVPWQLGAKAKEKEGKRVEQGHVGTERLGR